MYNVTDTLFILVSLFGGMQCTAFRLKLKIYRLSFLLCFVNGAFLLDRRSDTFPGSYAAPAKGCAATREWQWHVQKWHLLQSGRSILHRYYRRSTSHSSLIGYFRRRVDSDLIEHLTVHALNVHERCHDAALEQNRKPIATRNFRKDTCSHYSQALSLYYVWNWSCILSIVIRTTQLRRSLPSFSTPTTSVAKVIFHSLSLHYVRYVKIL